MDLLRVGAAGAGVRGCQPRDGAGAQQGRGHRVEYQEMRHETVKEIYNVKIEMAGKAR